MNDCTYDDTGYCLTHKADHRAEGYVDRAADAADQRKRPVSGLAYTYDWQNAPRTSFESWLLPTLVSPNTDLVEALAEPTERYTKVTLSMQVNGIEVDAQHLITRLNQNFDYSVEQRAVELVNELGMEELRRVVSETERAVTATIRTRMREAGIRIDEED